MTNEEILALLTEDEKRKTYASVTGIITNWLRSAGINASDVKAFCSVEAIGAEIANAFLVPMVRGKVDQNYGKVKTATERHSQTT